ncbi:ABC transporter ATP-binding protein [Variovorax sp. J2P1-59]|uniref:ABC transporter ATP-binding protein n=1 Tax=Variovorax flavidus TaxID=3053501 RepID=UPI0025761C32|nr:ABC transporter ATP-binding protein [Variovorax sp. J2P1-59]MDM0074474.1 ABC transporter ATP-binding protein [Variovorax sp. J2P1-59]
MLALEQVSYRYPGTVQAALDGVSLSAHRGSVVGLLGPNGAGKTTLISHLSGALAVQSGRVLIDGEPLQAVRARMPTRIAVAPQEHAFYPMLTVAENLACFASAGLLSGSRKQARVSACMEFAQLGAFAGTRAERLSGGLKRRLNLAIALLAEPELLLFDEPTVGVDPQSRAFVLEAIKTLANEGAAVIYASHYMEEIEAIADRVVILDHGRVLREDTLEALLSEDATVLSVRADGVGPSMLERFGVVEQDAGLWRVQLAAGVRPAEVLAALDAAGVTVRHADFGRQNLEQLFMALTHHSLRDS